MYAFIGVIHVLVCAFLVVSVLLQSGKGGGLAGAFGGGGTQAVFGGRGAATFLSRATTVLAILFMVTSLTMTLLGSNNTRRSALAKQAQEEGVAAPFTPTAPPGSGDEGSQPTQGVMPMSDLPAGSEAPAGTPPASGDGSTPAQSTEPPSAAIVPPGGN
ncbi:MAG: preprotein translocase subunit SecG [bacterium]